MTPARTRESFWTTGHLFPSAPDFYGSVQLQDLSDDDGVVAIDAADEVAQAFVVLHKFAWAGPVRVAAGLGVTPPFFGAV